MLFFGRFIPPGNSASVLRRTLLVHSSFPSIALAGIRETACASHGIVAGALPVIQGRTAVL